MLRTSFVLALCGMLAIGCTGDDDSDTSDSTDTTDDTDTGDTDPGIPIPDPGSGEANWTGNDNMSTPQTAWPVGDVSSNPFYVEGTAGTESESAYYVFRADGSFDLTIEVFGGAEISFVHLHDGEGGVFGDELTPTASTNTTGTWPVQDNKVYVFEVHVDGGGFF